MHLELEIATNRVNYQLEYLINITLWKKEIKKWNKLYKTKKYKFEKPDNIYNMIIKLFQKI